MTLLQRFAIYFHPGPETPIYDELAAAADPFGYDEACRCGHQRGDHLRETGSACRLCGDCVLFIGAAR